ncbi:M14 family zinc carboxypeptidase [Cellulomonas cellasea]|uniref:M14 family zinc carboxypeptidase n=1 Tax=Cellulomonas cellasea TaxID=43670 RepID=UPI0025A33123|nr:M14 family zinc carboxypeptidase [Cellulomonas cellasea]MDM8084392.1 M14 family zinc carboxypeptidase [Cellulomonas cellasea]
MSTSTTAVGSLEDILGRTHQVPPMHDFPTVDALLASFDDLVAAHPGIASSRRIGTSRLGEPIPMVSIGHGRRQHLLFAGVHPNEPIGFRMLQHLAALLCDDDALRESFDATWHLIPCIDPDGTRLNEGWYGDPTRRTVYARQFYRPAPNEQVEWTFPFAHKDAWFDQVLPETQALMRVIDEVKPQMMVSLHNAELGGVYYYLSEDVPGAVEALHAIPAGLGLPLDTGEPESPALQAIAPAVFGMLSTAGEYDYLEELGVDPTGSVGGESSSAYASRHGTVSLVAELPYWSHPAADDDTATDTAYRDVVLAKAAGLEEMGAVLGGILDEAAPDLTIRSPFLRASEAFVPMMSVIGGHERMRAERPECDRPATVAEVFSNDDLVRCFRLRYGGMLLRALDAEVAAGTATARVRRLRERMAEVYDAWTAEADAVEGLEVLDVNRLVGVQLGAALALARCLAAREEDAG